MHLIIIIIIIIRISASVGTIKEFSSLSMHGANMKTNKYVRKSPYLNSGDNFLYLISFLFLPVLTLQLTSMLQPSFPSSKNFLSLT
jgi:hypothetical protein